MQILLGEVPFSCDSGWVEYGGHCYIQNSRDQKWWDAQVHLNFFSKFGLFLPLFLRVYDLFCVFMAS